jgi:hypothetical protein
MNRFKIIKETFLIYKKIKNHPHKDKQKIYQNYMEKVLFII